MSENDLVETLLAELRDEGRLSPVTEAQVRQYADAVAEVERISSAVARMEPGSPEHKRASTALGKVERSRDALGRALGLTDRARRERTKRRGSTGGVRLSDWFLQDDDGEPLHLCALDAYLSDAGCACARESA
jgi:hypothetical protein